MHTNETTHFQLPIFVANDTPAWLVDWNGAMNEIDSALYSIQQGSGTIATDLATVQANLTTLEGIVESQGTSISSLASALTSAQGTINTITSLIGNGEPTTTDKTIIGAINEINSEVNASYNFGTAVDITNVTSSSPYVAPSDGVIELSGGNYGFIIRVRIDGVRVACDSGVETYAGSSIAPVRKGQSVYTESLIPSTQNQTAKFYPYVKI